VGGDPRSSPSASCRDSGLPAPWALSTSCPAACPLPAASQVPSAPRNMSSRAARAQVAHAWRENRLISSKSGVTSSSAIGNCTMAGWIPSQPGIDGNVMVVARFPRCDAARGPGPQPLPDHPRCRILTPNPHPHSPRWCSVTEHYETLMNFPAPVKQFGHLSKSRDSTVFPQYGHT
jgi:hypothetical protein